MYEIVAASGVRREIPDDYRYNAKKLKHLKHVLHNVSVALGTLTSAVNEISRVKGPEISPDGLLGGAGYIIPLKDIKHNLINSVHSLGDIADCLADELSNPKWNAEDDKEVKELLKEKEEIEDKVEEDIGSPDVIKEDIDPSDVSGPEKEDIDPSEMLGPEKEDIDLSVITKNTKNASLIDVAVKKSRKFREK